jgi:hypothetical protein
VVVAKRYVYQRSMRGPLPRSSNSGDVDGEAEAEEGESAEAMTVLVAVMMKLLAFGAIMGEMSLGDLRVLFLKPEG